jgi:ComF family protein
MARGEPAGPSGRTAHPTTPRFVGRGLSQGSHQNRYPGPGHTQPGCASCRQACMMLGLVARLLWPARCVACSAFVPEGQAFCDTCLFSVAALDGLCPGCGLPFSHEGWPAEMPCPSCQAMPLPFSRVWAVLAYGGAATQAILHLKHGRRRHLVRPLGALLAPAVAAAIAGGMDVLCPVPLHPRRLRERGFNQSLDLLRVAQMAARPRRALIVPNGLCRIRDTPALGRESPTARRRILAGAFVVRQPARFEGRRILLLDDVMTTGATFGECARVLREAGAVEVQVAALARVVS